MPNTPSLKAKVRGIDKILKALPEIKERLSKDNSWESIKSLCQPLGLTDTAFRDNPRVNDYLLSEKYWQDRLKKLLPKGKPQSPQPVWDAVTEWFYLWCGDKTSLDELVKIINKLLASQTSTLKRKLNKLEKLLVDGPSWTRGEMYKIVEDILNSL